MWSTFWKRVERIDARLAEFVHPIAARTGLTFGVGDAVGTRGTGNDLPGVVNVFPYGEADIVLVALDKAVFHFQSNISFLRGLYHTKKKADKAAKNGKSAWGGESMKLKTYKTPEHLQNVLEEMQQVHEVLDEKGERNGECRYLEIVAKLLLSIDNSLSLIRSYLSVLIGLAVCLLLKFAIHG